MENELNKAFESSIRLRIMSVLMVNQQYDFTGLRELLGLTDGNLATHLRTLEKDGYISMKKSFLGRKPNTSYSISPLGEVAFKAHLQALECIINGTLT